MSQLRLPTMELPVGLLARARQTRWSEVFRTLTARGCLGTAFGRGTQRSTRRPA